MPATYAKNRIGKKKPPKQETNRKLEIIVNCIDEHFTPYVF